MSKIGDEKFVFLDWEIKNKNELFLQIAKIAQKEKIVKVQKDLIQSFTEREELESTAFEDGFAIPHARSKAVTQPAVFFVRFKNAILWDQEKEIQIAILLLIPEGQGDYLDILSGIATKLVDEKIRQKLKKSNSIEEIANIINEKQEQKQNVVVGKKALTVIGITACATGVVHTYMARDALLEAGKKLNWNVAIETQGQKGQEFVLTDEQISKADGIIIAADIGIDVERFAGKKVFYTGTKNAINDNVGMLQKAISKGQKITGNKEMDTFAVKDKKKLVSHLMNGISYMIPFIVFAGIVSAIIGSATHAAGIDISKDYDELTGGVLFLKILNDFAGIGFTVMMGVAGAYIANSIAGRAAIAPAFILTMAGNNPKLIWQGYFRNLEIWNPFANDGAGAMTSMNNLMQPLNIFGAVVFGLAVGYMVKWINTKWKISKYIQPIMPIIIIPVFLTTIMWIVWMFTFGPLLGIAVGYLNFGIMKMEDAQVGMALLGLVLGLLAGVDMGGPINKIASFGATAMMSIDHGAAMGPAAAAFAVAPLGCGISAMIFRNKMKGDKTMGINTTILGFMGISEGAIPFAAKYGWPVFTANILGSGLTGAIAGALHVRGHVGAWGGPIIAIFAGVDSGNATDVNGNFIGILWFLVAIVIGAVFHIVLLRLLLGAKDHEKLANIFKKEVKLQETKTA